MSKEYDNIVKRLNSTINDVKRKSLKILAVEAKKSIDMNFDAGGRPTKWAPRKRVSKKQKGTNTLVISGRMRNVSSLVDLINNKVVVRSNPLARDYSAIQHFGGVITRSARALRLRKTKSGRYQFAKDAHRRGIKNTAARAHTIRIQARPWLMIPTTDYSRILQSIKTGIRI